jgi:hypothetical protein
MKLPLEIHCQSFSAALFICFFYLFIWFPTIVCSTGFTFIYQKEKFTHVFTFVLLLLLYWNTN